MRYTLVGLDCPSCAARIEHALQQIKGLEHVTINFTDLTLDLPPERAEEARQAISRVKPGVKLVRTGSPGIPEENGENRRNLYLTGLAGAFLAAGIIFQEILHPAPFSWTGYIILLVAYLIAGRNVLLKAIKNLVRGKFLDEHFLMFVATLGAIAINQLPEAVAVMLFYSLGEYFQEKAVNRSRRSIAGLLDIRPPFASLLVNGEIRQVQPEEVTAGQVVVVRPGERIPLDGEVLEGESLVDTAALTGEPVPRRVEKGDEVLAGMINGQGLLTIRVTRPFKDSSLARILELVENAAARKAPVEKFITTFARYYTPAVVLAALALAILPPLVVPGATLSQWLYRALVFLVISCPCALVISIPLSYSCGIGRASREGILVKGASYLDALASLHTVVFDKTGTLTRGSFRVNRVEALNGFQEEEVLACAAAAGAYSTHPVARSIRQAWGREIPPDRVSNYREIPGQGVAARVAGKNVLVGGKRLLEQEGIPCHVPRPEENTVFVAINHTLAGYLEMGDEIRPDARQAIAGLKALGVKNVVMLSGDEKETARRVAETLGLDDYHARLLPEEKVHRVEELRAGLPARQKLAFVGDGINDAPAIARADVGVAMGGPGSDAAIEAADVVLMEDSPSRLAVAVEIARHTRAIVKQNIVLTLATKAFFLGLGALGLASIWEAVFADVGVTLLAIFNATRNGTLTRPARQGAIPAGGRATGFQA
jgi:Cd2+/Zn2+-exporting ATPase